MSMTHRECCVAEGEYLMALPAILVTALLDDSMVDALPWSDIEDLSGYCIDRPFAFPAGSCVDRGMGSQQAVFNEAYLVLSQMLGPQ